jgi:hypothetical protein
MKVYSALMIIISALILSNNLFSQEKSDEKSKALKNAENIPQVDVIAINQKIKQARLSNLRGEKVAFKIPLLAADTEESYALSGKKTDRERALLLVGMASFTVTDYIAAENFHAAEKMLSDVEKVLTELGYSSEILNRINTLRKNLHNLTENDFQTFVGELLAEGIKKGNNDQSVITLGMGCALIVMAANSSNRDLNNMGKTLLEQTMKLSSKKVDSKISAMSKDLLNLSNDTGFDSHKASIILNKHFKSMGIAK